MVFQGFSKNYLDILMLLLFQCLLYHCFLFPVIFPLRLRELLLLLSAGQSTTRSLLSKPRSSIQYCHKFLNVFECISLHSIKLYTGITIPLSLALSCCVLFILLIVNKWSTIFKCLFLLPGPAVVPVLVLL